MSTEVRKSAPAPTIHIIETAFYSRKGNKDELVINGDGAAIDAKSRWFTYTFKRPVFLTSIEISCEGYENYDKFDLEISHVDGTTHDEKINVNSGLVAIKLGKLCSGFRFRPEKKWFIDPKITSVVANGLYEDEFHDFEWSIKDYEDNLAALLSREAKISDREMAFSQLKADRVEIESTVGKAKAEYDQLVKSLATTKETLARLETQDKDLRQKNANAEESLRLLGTQVDQESAKLQDLVRELRLFPSEISGFVKEGNRSIKAYVLIGLPFLIIFLSILGLIFFNVVNLTQLYTENENIDIWTIFLTRIPFVLVAVALIEGSGYVVGRLVFEVIRINRQRVEFAKLSIIAKDVSAAAAQRVDGMTEEELFEEETRLKMDLLREHMKNYVGSEFEYKGTGLISAIKGVADRRSSKKVE